MTPSPSAAELLADLAVHGIDVQALGDAIRYRPKSAMTPALLARLRTHKAELTRVLDTVATMTAGRQSVEGICKDMAWRSAWERRFRTARHANFASLRRVLDDVLERAEARHRRRDWSAFASNCRYLHRLASGELWDEAERTTGDLKSDLTVWLI
jgi:hypothetical protein